MEQLRYRAPARSFLGDEVLAIGPSEKARAVVIPIPLEATVTFGAGTALGPEAIIAASNSLEVYDDELGTVPVRSFGLATLETEEAAQPLEAVLDQIENLVEGVLEAGKFPLILGGEHSLTIGAVRPFIRRYPELAVLHFDAHTDLRDSYRGLRVSHATVMRRVLEQGRGQLVSVGLRSISEGEMEFLNANRDRISPYWARQRGSWVTAEIVRPLENKPIYLSFDVDALDSGLMPATGTPEPGGIDFDQACAIIRAASEVGTIVGADLVELAPIPGIVACDVTAANLAYKIVCYALHSGAEG